VAEQDDSQERSEEPSSRKKDKAREEGQAIRSRELNTMALAVTGALGVWLLAPGDARIVEEMARTLFERAADPGMTVATALQIGLEALLWAVLPFLLLMSLTGIVSSLSLGGLVFSTQVLAFKGERLSPLAGFKRIFSAQAFMEMAKSLAKFLLITSVAMGVIWTLLDRLLGLSVLSVESALSQGAAIVGLALLIMGLAFIVIAAIDVPYQIHTFNKRLRMTKQEVRDEMKDLEGKPEVKSRIRQVQQEIARRRMLADVPDADVVITNPEHFSVAVRYDSAAMGAPVVLAKGVDEMAMRIRDVARTSRVVMVQSPPLARALFYTVKVGGEVPQGLYVAVAQVLAYVYQLRSYRSGQAPDVPVYRETPLPEEFRTPPGSPAEGEEA